MTLDSGQGKMTGKEIVEMVKEVEFLIVSIHG